MFIIAELEPNKVPILRNPSRKYEHGTKKLIQEGWKANKNGPKDRLGLREFTKGSSKAYVCVLYEG